MTSFSGPEVNLITLRSPTPARYTKMYKSLIKRFKTNLVTGTIVPTIHLNMNIGTVFSYVNLFGKSLINNKKTIIDINALSSSRLKLGKDLIVDFRTPLAYELNWLGHGLFSTVARINESALKDIGMVIAANENMAKYCSSLGAKHIIEIPNYPTSDFKPTIDSVEWKLKNKVSNRIVLFTGGVRLREIYGLDLLLESWRKVEESLADVSLVILGDEAIDYIQSKSRALNLKNVILPGIVNRKSVANWINCSDLCIAPRTPGFSDYFYNFKDSTKISEYAALKKPIVATCYAPSPQYLLVEASPDTFAEGIFKGLEGKVRPSEPHFWEENEPRLLDSIESFWSG